MYWLYRKMTIKNIDIYRKSIFPYKLYIFMVIFLYKYTFLFGHNMVV